MNAVRSGRATPTAPIAVSRYDDGAGIRSGSGDELFGSCAGLHGDKGVWKLIESGRHAVAESMAVDATFRWTWTTGTDYRALLAWRQVRSRPDDRHRSRIPRR